MDLEDIYNRLSNVIKKNRPADPVPVVFVSSENENKSEEEINKSPKWSRSTKKTVIICMVFASIIILLLLRNMITPLIISSLMVFYLKPIVFNIEDKWKISHKFAVIIVFGIFLIIAAAIVTAGGFSIYGQVMNLFDTLNNSMDNLPNMILDILGGEQSLPGRYFSRFVMTSQNSEFNQQIEGIIRGIGSRILVFIQNFSSKIGWFFFVYGFSFFIVWESKKNENEPKSIKIPGYDYDLEMARYHLSLIWRRFLWGQAMLLIIALIVYSFLYIILGVKYAFILAVAVALTRMIPYIGSFFAWAAVALVTLFQESRIFGIQPLPYAVMVVLISFLIDKFMDGFIQPKFLAETLKVHPAAVLASALICGRAMGFLGIFLSAPIVATIKLIIRYIIRKLRDEDPWENIETVEEPLPLNIYLKNYKNKISEIYDKLLNNIRNIGTRLIGGKGHGSNGF
ncbi:MAG: AI-2E family transporter [Anaerolineaceae bacterium]|nr:AI-2E family transporter [Anaerolineaceae bacterium]